MEHENHINSNELPEEVLNIIESQDLDADEYKELSRMEEELKAVHWYMDFYLNGEMTELRPMTKEEIKQYEEEKAEYKIKNNKED